MRGWVRSSQLNALEFRRAGKLGKKQSKTVQSHWASQWIVYWFKSMSDTLPCVPLLAEGCFDNRQPCFCCNLPTGLGRGIPSTDTIFRTFAFDAMYLEEDKSLLHNWIQRWVKGSVARANLRINEIFELLSEFISLWNAINATYDHIQSNV